VGRRSNRTGSARYDGRGYPDGLAGSDIPLDARIVAVADSFDDMTLPGSTGRRRDRAPLAAPLRGL
jgi:response regulator RpfG family c-di-GMP phosphodiesterase